MTPKPKLCSYRRHLRPPAADTHSAIWSATSRRIRLLHRHARPRRSTRPRIELPDRNLAGCRKGKGDLFPPEQWTWPAVRRVVLETPCDVMYLNSVFSPRYTLLPLAMQLARAIPSKPTILAPRGELSLGALAIKKAKKHAFLRCMRVAGLYRNVENGRRRVRKRRPTSADASAIKPAFPSRLTFEALVLAMYRH